MHRDDSWEHDTEMAPRPPSPFRFSVFLHAVRKRRTLILVTSIAFTAVVLLLSLVMKKTYESTCVILPPKQEQSTSVLLSGAAGNLASLGGGGALGAVSLKNPNEVYTSLLESRTLNTNIVNQFNLKAYYHQATMQGALAQLKRHTTFEMGKDNLIHITARTHDRDFSSQLANAFVDQLHAMNTSLALTESAQRRLFYEEQLNQEKVLLAKAETDLQETQTRTGVLQPTGQADMVARSISALRTQIAGREAELQSMKTFAAPGNPDYLQLQAQVASLQGQLGSLENSAKAQTPGDIEVPTAKLPKSALEYARNYREVQQHEQVYGLLLKQFEAAKIDESKTAPVIEVVDRAIPAELPSGLPWWLIGSLAFVFAVFLNVCWIAGVYLLAVMEKDRKAIPLHS